MGKCRARMAIPPGKFGRSRTAKGESGTTYGRHTPPALRLISSKCLDTEASPNAGRRPRPAVSRHLVLVSDHASTDFLRETL